MGASQFRPKYAKVRVHFSKFVVRPKVRAQDFHIIINARICENCPDARAIQCCSCRNRIGFASPHFILITMTTTIGLIFTLSLLSSYFHKFALFIV